MIGLDLDLELVGAVVVLIVVPFACVLAILWLVVAGVRRLWRAP